MGVIQDLIKAYNEELDKWAVVTPNNEHGKGFIKGLKIARERFNHIAGGFK